MCRNAGYFAGHLSKNVLKCTNVCVSENPVIINYKGLAAVYVSLNNYFLTYVIWIFYED